MVSLHTHRVGKCSSTIMSGCHYLSPPPPTPTFIDICLPVFISDICTRGAVSFRNTLLLPFYLLVLDIPAAGVLAGALHRFYLLREVAALFAVSTDSIL